MKWQTVLLIVAGRDADSRPRRGSAADAGGHLILVPFSDDGRLEMLASSPTPSDIVNFARALRVGIFEFHWRAQEDARLPRFKGSTVRGAVGWAFKRLVCVRPDGLCERCPVRSRCHYPYVFETSPPVETSAFRGQRTAPHPYVLEPPLEEKGHYAAGEPMRFRLLLLGRAVTYLPHLILAADLAGRMGIGRGRARFALEAVFVRDAEGRSSAIYDGPSGRLTWDADAPRLEAFIRERWRQLALRSSASLRLRLLTPVRMRIGGDLQAHLPFDLLVRSLLRRLWQLVLVHGEEVPHLDPHPWIERACAIPILRQTLAWRDWERYSHRQRTRMRLGGFMGEVEYELSAHDRDLFLPLLIVGELLHIGTGTTFGLGKYEILDAESDARNAHP
ncbi:hypothetical protein HRbin08_02164 [bacterium HR08]|nr:hypothetical protein HRbin08_02164 [bacterium HR08]